MYNANANELEILKYWDAHKCFEKSVSERPENKPYVFYDGPPFATGLPHYGHIVASLMKDVVPRYFTMRGFRVERKWGWDCHGLPVENIIEKDLNLNSKKDIENYGVDKFNEACNATVLKYASEWKKTIKRMGRWVDMDNDYKTMDVGYMESAWWVFKELWEKDLVYKGHKAMHICPRCVTPLSNFEVTQGYKDVKDLSVTAEFILENGKEVLHISEDDVTHNHEDVKILAWTTTPWTLPGNVLLAVNNDINYFVVEVLNSEDLINKQKHGGLYIVAKDRFKEVFKDYISDESEWKGEYCGPEIIKEIRGKDLVGLKYKPLFPYFANTPNAFRVVAGDFVSTTDGTGVVHIAPAFGEDDYNIGKNEGLPLVQHVSMDGRFIPAVTDFAGMEVKPKEDPTKTDVEIIKWLAANRKLFSKEKFEHSYPHCWRCDTPLLNYATSCWFIKVTELKDQLLKNNEAIRWVPDNFKQGRFGEWLSGARDWAVSRNRYWGNPLPVWESADGDHICVGSVEELAQLTGKKLTKIIFVRHGESEKNIKNIHSSVVNDHPLTKKGEKEVDESVKHFTDKVDIIISSPVLRCKQTAEKFQKKLKADLIFDDLITEYFYGSWENKSKEELAKREDYQNYRKISVVPKDKYHFRLGGDGETRVEITERVRKFLEKVTKEYAGKTILVVSHGGINAGMTMALQGVDYGRFFSEENIIHQQIKHFYLDEDGKEYNLHKHFVDKMEIKKDSKVYHRVPEVLDCWFESGSMPYGQMHYPFENKEKFEAGFPAQFIAEGQDQTRGWFYTLHVLATALTSGKKPSIPKKKFCPAFNNVIVNGIVLAEDGKKMSKRLKNYPEPDIVLEKYGADAMRYYLVTAPVMQAEALNFSEAGVREMYNKLVNTLWNVVEFYKMYSDKGIRSKEKGVSENVLDKWILAKLNLLVKDVTEGMENYQLARASRPIVEFVTELSQWYVRRSRDRFKSGGDVVILSEAKDPSHRSLRDSSPPKADQNDKQQAVATLHEVLFTLSKVMAPFTPFMAEKIYLVMGGEKESVHLEAWPEANEFNPEVVESMISVREIVECGLAARSSAGIKVKQPLLKMFAPICGCVQDRDQYLNIIKEELNIKEVIIIADPSELKEKRLDSNWEVKESQRVFVAIYKEITPELKAEGTAREIVRAINQIRKETKLTINDKVAVSYVTDDVELKKVLVDFGDEIKKSVLAERLEEKDIDDGVETEVGGKKIKLLVNLSS